MTATLAIPERELAFADKPFYTLTRAMFDCVHLHDFDRLATICDDDFGIIDINTEGGSEVIRDRAGWEHWFRSLFEKLRAMGAETWSEITRYEAVKGSDMGYTVVDFDQLFIAGGKRLRFAVIATIVWKLEAGEWREARYHSSLLSVKEES
ncbi:MAG: nuclear transport factor 2 family protein [Cyclobacteriaceae bacterium]|jgi:hypothetical protein|nr:nuclear transport factor 2 family protein [Cyclobacteriaceae bacterium]